MTVVFGLVEEGPAAQFYNASAAVRNGQLVHLHRKVNLPTYGNLEEGKLFAAGHRVDNFSVARDWNASLLICADLWNPALVHLAMLQHATILLAPVNSAIGAVSDDFSNPDGWDLASRFYAMMYGVPIVMCQPRWKRRRHPLLGRLAHRRTARPDPGAMRRRKPDAAYRGTALRRRARGPVRTAHRARLESSAAAAGVCAAGNTTQPAGHRRKKLNEGFHTERGRQKLPRGCEPPARSRTAASG